MFQSTSYPIENRPGLENQNLDGVMSTLRRLDAPSLFPGSESIKKVELARWLSDWHLSAYIDTTQLFSVVRFLSSNFGVAWLIWTQDDFSILMRTISSTSLLDDPKNIDPVLSTNGWQTLMTITRESARKFLLSPFIHFHSGSLQQLVRQHLPLLTQVVAFPWTTTTFRGRYLIRSQRRKLLVRVQLVWAETWTDQGFESVRIVPLKMRIGGRIVRYAGCLCE